MVYFFENCNKLSKIDISTFNESIKLNSGVFKGINNIGEIIISQSISIIIHQIFEELNLNWTIIEIK